MSAFHGSVRAPPVMLAARPNDTSNPSSARNRSRRPSVGTKLYVGNLNYNTTEASLREAFGANGREVTSVSIIMDRETGRSRGFAFVEMATPEGAQQALQELDGQELDGRMLRINEAREREARGSGGGGGRRRWLRVRWPRRRPRRSARWRWCRGGPPGGGGGYGGAPRWRLRRPSAPGGGGASGASLASAPTRRPPWQAAARAIATGTRTTAAAATIAARRGAKRAIDDGDDW